MEISIENYWKKQPKPEVVVKELWTRHFLMPLPEQENRVNELVMVARAADGRVAGVSTASQVFLKPFNNYFMGVRFMTAPNFRVPGLMSKLVMMTRDVLEADVEVRNGCVGLIALVENETMKKVLRKAVLPSGFVFAGNSPKGHQIRVYYFKGALIA